MGNKVTMDVIAGVNIDSTGLIVNTSKTGTGARSSVGVNSGKVYFEVHITGNAATGLCDEMNNLNTTGWPNDSSFAIQHGWATRTPFFISSIEYPYSNPINLDMSKKNIISFALDMEKYLLSIYLNGVLAMDSFELTGKLKNLGTKLYPFLMTGGTNTTGQTEWNFGATPFKYPIPEGYTSYDGNQSNTSRYLLKDDEGYKRLIPGSIKAETCVPDMISDTKPEGEVTCSGTSTDWYAYRVFNSSTDDNFGWESSSTASGPPDAWIQYKFTKPKIITKYHLVGTSNYRIWNPVQWALEGSNDGVNYEVLHTGTKGSIDTQQKERLDEAFNINNMKSFLYYRLHCLKKYSGCNHYMIHKLELFESDDPLIELVSTEYPTEDQFQEKGMSDIPSYGQLSNFDDLVTYAPNLLSKSLVKFKPKAKTVLSSGAINFSGKELKKVSLIGTDNARVLFSKDRGITWYNKIKPEKVSEMKTAEDNDITIVCTAEDGLKYSGWRCFDGQLFDDPQGYQWQTYRNNSNYVDHHWIRYDFGENNTRVVNRVYIQSLVNTSGLPGSLKDYSVEGSNDGLIWIELIKDSLPDYPANTVSNHISPSIPNTIPYRYVRINLLSNSIVGYDIYNITEIELYGQLTPTPISDISTQGLTPTQLTAITPDEWQAFMGDSSTLRFAYYLPDETANTDKLELTVDFIGE